ncbi:hypothetical protein RB195_014294 [Necator americanus]|uniref:Uncharacterized protein n=1 Tax=Necator americanus TaxID=51031 RepID=A0ABR1DZI5_NECAM
MESVDKTLASTQHLLHAIEQDDALLDDEYFMRKLEYLRMKHKETSDFLARILHQEECLPPSISTCTCKERDSKFQNEWSFSGCVSAKLVTRSAGADRSTPPSEIVAGRKEMVKSGFVVHELQEKGREKRRQATQHSDPEIRANQKPRSSKRPKHKTDRQGCSHANQYFYDWSEEKRERDECCEEDELQSKRTKEKMEEERRYDEERDQGKRLVDEKDEGEQYQGVTAKTGRSDERDAQFQKKKSDGSRVTNPTKFPRSKSVIEIREPQKFKTTQASTSKRDVVPEPVQNFVPQITVPQPFKMKNLYVIRIRLDLSRTWSQKEGKKRKSWKFSFTAHTVPISTYISTNPRVMEKAYIEAIRKRLTANLRKHFQEEALLRKSKSLGDIPTLARPVPLSTYVTPAQLQDYRRSRCASRRSVRLLVDANSPPLNNEHAVRSNISNKVRHILCIEGSKERKHPRPPIPDFHRLHAEMEEKLKNAPHKAVTVPMPFNLSNSSEHRHRQCKSTSPPRSKTRHQSKSTKEQVHVRSTHSSKIRMEAIKQREQKLFEERHKSEKFWEGKKEEMDLSRLKLLSSMGSYGNIQEEIERKTAEKRKHIMETAKDYEKYLAEMQQRVIDRPLIMEQQSIIAQKQKLARKFIERMAVIEKVVPEQQTLKMVKERKYSDISAGTYSVKSKAEQTVGEEDYADMDFESEEASGSKRRSNSSTSSSSSSTTDSLKNSTRSNSRSSAHSENSHAKESEDDVLP